MMIHNLSGQFKLFFTLLFFLFLFFAIGCDGNDDDDDSSDENGIDDDTERVNDDDSTDDDDVNSDDDNDDTSDIDDDDDNDDNDDDLIDTQVLISTDREFSGTAGDRQAVIFRAMDPFKKPSKVVNPTGSTTVEIQVCPLGVDHLFPVVLAAPGKDAKIRCTADGTLYATYLDQNDNTLKIAEDFSGTWSITDLASIENTEIFNHNIALDEEGNLHVAYADGEALYYLTNNSGGWISQQIDVGVLSIWEIDVDSNGFVHLLSSDLLGDNLNYYAKMTDTWSKRTIFTDIFTGFGYTSMIWATLSVAPDDTVVIYYHLTANSFFPSIECLSASVRWTPSMTENTPMPAPFQMLAFGPDGSDYLVYGPDLCFLFEGTEFTPVMFGERTGPEQWDVELIEDVFGWYPDITVDDSGFAHIAFQTLSGDIHYAHNRNGFWEVAVVDDTIP